MKYLLIAVFLAFFNLNAWANFQADSVGMKEVNGKKFIVHKVESDETLYSLSRRYNVSINKIVAHNPDAEFGLAIGTLIEIPVLTKADKKPEKPVNSKQIDNKPESQGVIHVVAPKETLYSISRKYNITIQQIKEWNQLNSNALDIGQKLVISKSAELPKSESANSRDEVRTERKTHVVKQSETLFALSRKYEVDVADLRKWNQLPSNEISIGQVLIVEGPGNNDQSEITIPPDTNALVTTRPQEVSPEVTKERLKRNPNLQEKAEFEEIIESGLAALIEGSDNTRKYLALHRTAEVGTIMRLRNEMNDQEVFVRVLGKLPDTGVNENIIVRISKSAYERLGAIDPKFRVTVSYLP
ncbi:MAG: LysM peptidoglycan-binding domain-containing protein [Fulvivirga sp.]|nr:LysM peptidoglycan-binding domain-containing protein [Fulvivirga sp.]